MFGKPGKMKCLNSLSSGGLAKKSTDLLAERMANKQRKREEREKQQNQLRSGGSVTLGRSRVLQHDYIKKSDYIR